MAATKEDDTTAPDKDVPEKPTTTTGAEVHEKPTTTAAEVPGESSTTPTEPLSSTPVRAARRSIRSTAAFVSLPTTPESLPTLSVRSRLSQRASRTGSCAAPGTSGVPQSG
eukprot:GHVU01100310.1.p3 GENE.GHVU01100310.1~~GHVU01100310.1.p3  ORF type:complete len:111 (+),score=16.86 GHVU01100310.1:1714-2046(+)